MPKKVSSSFMLDDNDNVLVSESTKSAGEDLVADVTKVEQRFSGVSVTSATAVTPIKTGAGFIHTATFSCNDAAATAGSIIFYNATSATGQQLFNWAIPAGYFAPFTIVLDMEFSVGLFVGYTTTNDVNVAISYR